MCEQDMSAAITFPIWCQDNQLCLFFNTCKHRSAVNQKLRYIINWQSNFGLKITGLIDIQSICSCVLCIC